MGRYVFKLPDIGEGVAEAEIVSWHVKVGATVAEDDPLVDVMTDKATVEIPAPRAGRVLATTGSPGDKVRVGSELLVLEVDGAGELPAPEKPASPKATTPGSLPAAAKRSAPVAAPAPPEPPPKHPEPSAAPRAGEKPLASPAVRRRAYELGIPLQFIRGTGPAAASAMPTSTATWPRAAERPSLPRVPALAPGGRASRRSRSSGSGAGSPSACRNPSDASRTTPMSRSST